MLAGQPCINIGPALKFIYAMVDMPATHTHTHAHMCVIKSEKVNHIEKSGELS